MSHTFTGKLGTVNSQLGQIELAGDLVPPLTPEVIAGILLPAIYVPWPVPPRTRAFLHLLTSDAPIVSPVETTTPDVSCMTQEPVRHASEWRRPQDTGDDSYVTIEPIPTVLSEAVYGAAQKVYRQPEYRHSRQDDLLPLGASPLETITQDKWDTVAVRHRWQEFRARPDQCSAEYDPATFTPPRGYQRRPMLTGGMWQAGFNQG